MSVLYTMKLLKNIPRKLFKSKKSPSSCNTSGSGTSSHSSSSELKKEIGSSSSTPKTVLNQQVDWLRNKVDVVDVNDFVQAFQVMDRHGDGKIRREELLRLLSRVGGSETEDEISAMLTEVDRDGDGCISLEELSFIDGAHQDDDELRGAFDFFDADHDGKITAYELYDGFRTIGDGRCTLEECRRMIKEVDTTNGDGFVCFQDFSRMMEHQLLR